MSDTGNRQDFDEVVGMAMFAADDAVIGKSFRTRAEETRAAVRAAFELALGNGLIQLAPREEWPEYIAMTPPYKPRDPEESR